MKTPTEIDYKTLGLKVGLELHQQLETATKLFCEDPTFLVEEDPDFILQRQLRPTQSELGEVDQAALFEFLKGRSFVYEGYDKTTCLVEQDEEPPHGLDDEAIDIALTMAILLNASPVNEIHVMRKIVIDGSNTGGFQRTAIVSLGGFIQDKEFGKIGIQTVCLEEDAARKIFETDQEVRYRLDRLGVPLIEIATAPDIHDPDIAEKVALKIGQLLRATRKVKRGIGTIRQDVNISIREGNLIEIKGVQQLDIISDLVKLEVQRQMALLEIKKELHHRRITPKSFNRSPQDVTSLFSTTQCKPIQKALSKGGIVSAILLPNCRGIIGTEIQPQRRFGTELADYVKYTCGVKGIFHTDELPNYGITKADLDKLQKEMNMKENDAVVFVAAPKQQGQNALNVVISRLITAFEGVPEETRGAQPDGTTIYLRPRPGAKRMYPETDVHPKKISPARISHIKTNLPEKPEEYLKKFMSRYDLNEQIATDILNSPRSELFETIIEQTEISPKLVAYTLGSLWVSLRRDGVVLNRIQESKFVDIFTLLRDGELSKDSLEDVLTWMANNPEKSAKDAIKALGFQQITSAELEEFIQQLVEKNRALIRNKGERALGGLMGDVMKHFKKNVDGKEVSSLLRRLIKKEMQK